MSTDTVATDDAPSAEPPSGKIAADETPTPIRTWLRARPQRPVWVIAVVLLVAQTVLRGVLAVRGSFYIDDFAFTGRAAALPFFSHDFLLHAYNSHVMPGSYVWVWVLTKIWPLSYGPVALVDTALQLLLGVLFYKLLRDLFGTRPAILVPFALFLFTPITLPAFLWWAAALNQLPQQLALVVALRCQVKYLRTGRTRAGVYGAVAMTAGLLFSEKSLFVVPLVAALTLFWFHSGAPLQRIRAMLRAHRIVWFAYLVIAVPYAVFYEVAIPSPVRRSLSVGSQLSLVGDSYSHAVIPGLLGGPWNWRPIGWAGALADPGSIAATACVLVAAVVVAITIALQRRAVFGWLVVGGYSLMNLVLLAVSRATFIGPVIGDEYRYVTDVALVAVLGVALAVIPIRDGEWRHGEVQRPEPRTQHWQRLHSSTVQELRELLAPLRGLAGALVLVVVFTVSCVLTTVRYDRWWSHNTVTPYLAAVKHDLAAANHPVLVDSLAPDNIAWALLYPYNLTSKLLAPLPEHPSFLATGHSSDRLGMVDDTGHLRQIAVDGFTAEPGSTPNCGWDLSAEDITVPLVKATLPGVWVMRIGYIASADATTVITAGRTTVEVHLHRG